MQERELPFSLVVLCGGGAAGRVATANEVRRLGALLEPPAASKRSGANRPCSGGGDVVEAAPVDDDTTEVDAALVAAASAAAGAATPPLLSSAVAAGGCAVYFGFSHTVNVMMGGGEPGSAARTALHATIAAVPDTRLLIEVI